MIGVKFPFDISSGSVAVTENFQDIIRSQVMFCLGSQVGERVMRPTWGIDIYDAVHSLGVEVETATKDAVAEAFRIWFRDYELREVQVRRNPQDSTMVIVEVRFGNYGEGTDLAVQVGTPVPGGAEIFDNEGL